MRRKHPDWQDWAESRSFWLEQGLSVRTASALADAGIHDIETLSGVNRIELQRLPNIGRSGLNTVNRLPGREPPQSRSQRLTPRQRVFRDKWAAKAGPDRLAAMIAICDEIMATISQRPEWVPHCLT
jgi:hypothetical protein